MKIEQEIFNNLINSNEEELPNNVIVGNLNTKKHKSGTIHFTCDQFKEFTNQVSSSLKPAISHFKKIELTSLS